MGEENGQAIQELERDIKKLKGSDGYVHCAHFNKAA
jgi:hypothetical protein